MAEPALRDNPLLAVLVEAARELAERRAAEREQRRATMRVVGGRREGEAA